MGDHNLFFSVESSRCVFFPQSAKVVMDSRRGSVASSLLGSGMSPSTDSFKPGDTLLRAGAPTTPVQVDDIDDDVSEGIVLNAAAIASSLRIPPALLVRNLGESKGPSLRVGHSMVSYEGNLYTFGGRSPSGAQYFGSVSRYIPSRMAWNDIESKGAVPMRRGDHSAVVVDDKMIVYGGRKQNMVFDDLYAFDFVLKTWEKIPFDASSSPGAIFNHSSAFCPTTRTLFVVGGVHLQSTRRNFVFGFDVRSQYWRSIRGPPTVDPAEIQNCICCVDDVGAKLIVAGAREDPTLCALHDNAQALLNGMSGFHDEDDSNSRLSIQMRAPSEAGSVGIGGSALKNKMTGAAEMSFTMMHMMDVHTKIWKRIRTEISPESPILFSMQHVSSAVLNNLSKQCCAMSATKRLWYFPVNLREVDLGALAASLSSSGRGTSNQPPLPKQSAASSHRSGRPGVAEAAQQPQPSTQQSQPPWMAAFGHEYGVFCLSLTDLTWSLSPLVMPKVKKNPMPGEDSSASRREAFTLRSAQDFERKYAFIVHTTGVGGTNPKEILALYGGVSNTDYACAIATPSLPPRSNGNVLDVLAQRNRARQAMGWSLDDDAIDEADERNASDRMKKPHPPPDRSPGASVSQRNLTPPPITGASTHLLDSGRLVSPGNAALPANSQSVPPVLQLGKSATKRRKASQVVRVLVPVATTAGSSQSAHGGVSQNAMMCGANPPLNILDSKEKLNMWIHQYYREECKWITEQRFATEKQFVLAKRAAAKAKNSPRGGGKRDEFSIPIPPVEQQGQQQRPKSSRSPPRKMGNDERRELRIRSGAIVGTLLLDAIDLHPEVKAKVASPKNPSPRRRSSYFNRRGSNALEQPPASPGEGDAATMSSKPITIAGALPLLRGQKKIAEADTEASRVARIHWAILRKYVLSGAAARVLSLVEESKCPDISWWLPQPVSSSSQLVMSPSLSTFTIIKAKDSMTNNKRLMAIVPTKPVPYQLPAKNINQLDATASPSGAMQYTPRQLGRPKSRGNP